MVLSTYHCRIPDDNTDEYGHGMSRSFIKMSTIRIRMEPGIIWISVDKYLCRSDYISLYQNPNWPMVYQASCCFTNIYEHQNNSVNYSCHGFPDLHLGLKEQSGICWWYLWCIYGSRWQLKLNADFTTQMNISNFLYSCCRRLITFFLMLLTINNNTNVNCNSMRACFIHACGSHRKTKKHPHLRYLTN